MAQRNLDFVWKLFARGSTSPDEDSAAGVRIAPSEDVNAEDIRGSERTTHSMVPSGRM